MILINDNEQCFGVVITMLMNIFSLIMITAVTNLTVLVVCDRTYT